MVETTLFWDRSMSATEAFALRLTAAMLPAGLTAMECACDPLGSVMVAVVVPEASAMTRTTSSFSSVTRAVLLAALNAM